MKIPKLAVNDLTAYYIKENKSNSVILQVSKVVAILDQQWGEIPLGIKTESGKWIDPPEYLHPFKMDISMLCSPEDQKIPSKPGTSGCVFRLAKNSKVYAEAVKFSK